MDLYSPAALLTAASHRVALLAWVLCTPRVCGTIGVFSVLPHAPPDLLPSYPTICKSLFQPPHLTLVWYTACCVSYVTCVPRHPQDCLKVSALVQHKPLGSTEGRLCKTCFLFWCRAAASAVMMPAHRFSHLAWPCFRLFFPKADIC